MTITPPPLPNDPREALDRALAHILSALKSVNHANTRAAIEKMHSTATTRTFSELLRTLGTAQYEVMEIQRGFLQPTPPEKPAANGAALGEPRS